MIKRVEVFDMDGTVVCSLHRYRTITKEDGTKAIDLPYWRANEHKAYADRLLPLADFYKACIADPEVYVIIATARVLGDADMAFIRDILGEPNKIISRQGNDDCRGGVELKVTGLRPLRTLRQFAKAAWTFYEDNETYLYGVCKAINAEPVFIPSMQGY